ncbi:MAG: molybdenum cofactor guanylyltransferase [Pirellulaceae bacterium]
MHAAQPPPSNSFAGVVLCGGKSRRMGESKATLPFGDELMVQRVVRLLSEVVSPIVVVAAEGQTLPELPAGTLLARDQRADRGPLEGLQAGLAALENRAEAAFATSCDVPLLQPAFVRRMLAELDASHQIAVAVEDKFAHPLAAVYRVGVLPVIRRLLAEDRLRPLFLFDEVPTRRVDVATLREVDAELHSLKNCNFPEDYREALRLAGFDA